MAAHLRVTLVARAFATPDGKKIMAALARVPLDVAAERKLVSELNALVANLAQRDARPRVAKSENGFGKIMSAALEGKK